MVRLTAAVLVGCLLAVPPALALDASSPLFAPSVVDLEGIGSEAALLLWGEGLTEEATVGSVLDTADEAPTAVTGLLECRPAVQLTLVGWGGNDMADRDRDKAFVREWTVTRYLTHQVPVYGLVSERVDGILGLIDATRSVSRIVGYDLVSEPVTRTYDLAVHLAWRDVYTDWTYERTDVYVGVLAGTPFVEDGEGHLVQVCDGSVIHDRVPSMDRSGYDRWSGWPQRDGWHAYLVSRDVHLASPEEVDTLPRSQGWWLCQHRLFWSELDAATEALGLDMLADGDSSVTVLDDVEAGAMAPRGAASVASAASGSALDLAFAGIGAAVAAMGAALLAMRRWR